jgi:hypothetical protein
LASSSEPEPESDPDPDPADASLSSEPESDPESDSTLVFFCGTTAFSVFFCALLALPLDAAEAFEAALGLF